MATVYVDPKFKCHPTGDSTMTEIQVAFFDGKCDTFIEGYCYDTSMGYAQIYPWKDYRVLAGAQQAYEQQLLADYRAALTTLGVSV